jgi:hypothetical protein
MESPRLCACRQTVQRFLGLDIDADDLSDARLKEWMLTLPLRLGTGLWIIPFRGLPESAFRFVLDLVYLDRACRVIEVVASFPPCRVSAPSPSAASILVLPARSISSSQTKPGDQPDIIISESGKKKMGRLKSWFNRWRCRNARKARREPSHPRRAHFRSGASAEGYALWNVSVSRIFVVTKERWYPGTTTRVRLSKTGNWELGSERSICVHSKAVRWGNEGLGLHCVLKDRVKTRRKETALGDGADGEEIDVFLRQLLTLGEPRLALPHRSLEIEQRIWQRSLRKA